MQPSFAFWCLIFLFPYFQFCPCPVVHGEGFSDVFDPFTAGNVVAGGFQHGISVIFFGMIGFRFGVGVVVADVFVIFRADLRIIEVIDEGFRQFFVSRSFGDGEGEKA